MSGKGVTCLFVFLAAALACVGWCGGAQAQDVCEALGACNRTWQTIENPWFFQTAVSHDGYNAAQSAAIPDGEAAALYTEVTGPCTLSLWYKVSASTDGGFLIYVGPDPIVVHWGDRDWTKWTYVLGAGTHNITVYFWRYTGDPGAGSNCAWVDQFLVEESVPPTGSVTVDNGAASTGSPDVSLGLTYADTGAGVTGMRFSNNGSTWSAWQKPAATKAWTLAPGDGTKTVRAQFRDKAGNVSERYTDTILLDQTPPTGGIVINGGDWIAPDLNVTLSLSWEDGAGSGVSRMRFSNNGSTWSPWEAVAPTKAWTLSSLGVRTVRVQYLDRAGNVSPVYSDYINVVPAP
jgi:hypothetical protein